jgi:maleate isomerase
MIGWRAKFGVMVPCGNTTIEPELYRMAPEGVTFHFDRIGLVPEGESPEEVERRLKGYAEEAVLCARNFSKMPLDGIAFGCTSGSLIEGHGHDQKLIKRLGEITPIPITTTSTAVIEALKAMEINKVVVVTPYIREINEKEKLFLEAHGIKVLRIESIPNVTVKPEVVPTRVYQLAREIDIPEATGVFISCTALRSIEILEFLEQDSKKPVISSNQATFWKMMKMAGIRPSIKGYGRLLEAL